MLPDRLNAGLPQINLRIPAGVDDGSRLRVRGEGNAGRRGGDNGDLYVFLSVKPDKGPRGSSSHPYVRPAAGGK